MKFNKMLAKTLIFATAVSFAQSFGTIAKAGVPAVTFSAAEKEVTVPANTYWGTVKLLKKEKGSNFDAMEGGKTVYYKIENVEKIIGEKFNISNLKFGKDTYIAFGSTEAVTKGEWVVKKFAAEDKTLKAYYGLSKSFGKFTGNAQTFGGEFGFIGVSTGKAPTEVSTAELEVHNGNGLWGSYANFFGAAANENVNTKLKALVQTGATLYFRKKGNDGNFIVNSKETKLKIPAQAAAPKVIIKDGKTGLKKGLEYIRLDAGTALAAQPWVTVDNLDTVKYATQIFTEKTKGHDFYVRTAAKGKKGPSKFAKLSVTYGAKPEIVEGGVNETNAIKNKGAVNLIKNTNGDFKVGLTPKLSYDITKGVELTNSSDKNYECYLSYKDAEPPVDAKWFTLKAAKDPSKPTKIVLKYSATEKPNTYAADKNSKLYIRHPAEKQVGNKVVLASDALGFKFNVENIEQTVKFTTTHPQVAIENDTSKAKLHSVKAADLSDYTLKIKATDLVKTGTKPKVKIDKVDGVKVTVGAFEDVSMEAEVKIEVTAKAFATTGDMDGKKIGITLNYEGLKDKKFEISFSHEAKPGG